MSTDMQAIVLEALEKARPFLNGCITSHISAEPSNTFIVILDHRNGCLTHKLAKGDQSKLPVDTIDHPHKDKTHFYFIIILDDLCYEGYLYLLDPNFHISLLGVSESSHK